MTTPFLTAGRLALADRLRAHAVLFARVRTWQTSGAAPRRHGPVAPADCPALALAPAALEPQAAADAVDALPQDLTLTLTAEGPDAAGCEELACAALDCLAAADADLLGLADRGLLSVRPVRMTWHPGAHSPAPRMLWQVELTVRLNWLIANE
jgi:hypothetical protein